MPDLTLGISPCPNDVFIFAGLLRGCVSTGGVHFQVDFQDVETLNRRAQRGELDVVKISYANYPHCAGAYDLLECGGALGRGCGPLLLSHGGGWDPAHEILVPGEYTTANFLLDFALQRPARKRFLPFDALYEHLCRTPGAQGVVIHEKRFTFAQDGLHLVQDLGALWEERTGYPIPLGTIIARKGIVPRAALEGWIRESLTWSERHGAEAFALCREHAQDLNEDVINAHIALYVNEFSRDLGPEGKAAVEFFLRQRSRPAAAAGSVP